MNPWIQDAVFYHIYPLGACGAPLRNNFSAAMSPRLEQLEPWLDHIQALGANALYLGPLFESTSHGYDTADYYWVDRRLGNNETLARFSAAAHRRGLRLVLDGVFNHTGRDFWAFRDVLTYGEASRCRDWFTNLRFGQTSPYGDRFSYEGWNGHYSLVKLNLANPEVRDHLFGAVSTWMREFEIDGLRLDAADCLDFDFIRDLTRFCRDLRPGFWLMGEVIHGDYRRWANPAMLDSVTNYECYKGLYSSLAEHNYFEIAYALNRQFGGSGLYRDMALYDFVDNHDVNRVASNLLNPAHLFPLYLLLFSMPGVPSIYYGSEWGVLGKKEHGSDQSLRPQLDLAVLRAHPPRPGLAEAIARLAALRQAEPALRTGGYEQLFVGAEQFVFARTSGNGTLVVALNASAQPALVSFRLPGHDRLRDLLNPPDSFSPQGESWTIELPPCWGRILQ